MARRVNFYATREFNRAVERREDVAWIREKLADPASRLYPIWRMRNYVSDPEAPRAVVLDPDRRAALLEVASTVVLLGMEQETAHFLIDISHLDEPAATELGLVGFDRGGPALAPVDRPGRTPLARSAAYRAYQLRLEDGRRYLTSSDTTPLAA